MGELDELRRENDQLRRELDRERSGGRNADFLRALLKSIPAYVARADLELKLRYANHVADGLSMDDVIGASVYSFMEPDQIPIAKAAIDRCIERSSVESYQVDGAGPQGEYRRYENIVTPYQDDSGERGLVFVVFDVTERHQQDLDRARSEEQLRLAVEATGVGLWSWDVRTGQVEWNDCMFKLTGLKEPLPPAECVQRTVHPDDLELVLGAIRRVREQGRDQTWLTHRVVFERDGQSEVRWVLARGIAQRDDNGQLVSMSGALLDTTALRELELRVQQAERMEAIGTLTTGVAHNFNNALAIIRPTLDLLQRHVSDRGRELMAEATEATERAADVVRQLMSFAGKRSTTSAQPHDVTELAESTVRLASESSRGVRISFKSEVVGAHVVCDGQELEQVLNSLIVNASDVLAAAGTKVPTIDVEVKLVERDSSQHVRVCVTDNGPGVNDAARPHIFEPFFSTKQAASGSGLGLAMSWAVARALGGSLEHEDASPGSRFCLYLPIADEPQPSLTPSTTPQRQRLRILLVEDDAQVQRITAAVLTHEGHEVTTASTLADALKKAEGTQFDTILLDQSLPDGIGTHGADSLRGSVPDGRILLFTGQDVSHDEVAKVDGVITKPVGARELLSRLSGAKSN